MNHSSDCPSDHSMTDVMIQKLVDGELDHLSRSRALSSLSEDSPHWKRIALAFVEAQLFDESLCRSPELCETPRRIAKEPKPSTESFRRHRVAPWLALLAASLLIGFLFGFLTKEDSAPIVTQSPYEPTPAVIQEDAGSVDANLALSDALSRSVAPVPEAFRRALRKAGYSIQDKQTITNVDLPSGGQIELPTRRVNVTFVGLSSFQ